jgi:hypothetical protein
VTAEPTLKEQDMTHQSTRAGKRSAHSTESGDERPGRVGRLVTRLDEAVIGPAAFALAVCRAISADLADLAGRIRRTRTGTSRSWN